ncbi:hypothetical protein HanHA89_Chr09g0323441 [Helianthus annuus]|nr:hypothetical protein HanHA89_Chr09g0323441 [Helianthus annuus]
MKSFSFLHGIRAIALDSGFVFEFRYVLVVESVLGFCLDLFYLFFFCGCRYRSCKICWILRELLKSVRVSCPLCWSKLYLGVCA